jgi:uncharacterized Tic20 family protein
MTSPDQTPAADEQNSSSSDDRTLAALAHVLGIFTWFVGALVIWLIRKDQSSFVGDQAKEALNFQITIGIANVIAGVTMAIFIGCLLMPAVLVVNLVFCIIAAVAASKGEPYRYPICLRLIN